MRCVGGGASDMLRGAVRPGGSPEVDVVGRACNLLWIGLLLAIAACGTPASSAPLVCRDRVTGKCYPCAGAQICVDSVACTAIQCGVGHPFGGDAIADTTGKDTSDTTIADGSGDGSSDASDGSGTGDGGDSQDVPPIDAGCESGTHRCKGDHQVQNCIGGQWLDGAACPTGLVCDAGVCGCPNACPALNLTECLSGVQAVRTCQLDSDKCLAWGVPVACKPGEICEQGLCKTPTAPCSPACSSSQTCVGGQCVDKGCVPACSGGQVCQAGSCVSPGTGTLTCAQISACSGNCPIGDSNCPGECIAQGTASAQSTFATYKGCIKATCKALADQGKVNETMFCIYQYCASEQAACLGSGTGTCAELNDCMNGCGSSATCTSNCNSAASKQAALDFYGLMTCVDSNCGSLGGDAQVQCAQSSCSAAFTKCLGTSSGGGTLTSCAQIAQCQAGCADIPCKKNCTAQGTAQAQADVNAFIDCRDQKCGSFCGSGGSTNLCNNCVLSYCAAQLDACSQ